MASEIEEILLEKDEPTTLDLIQDNTSLLLDSLVETETTNDLLRDLKGLFSPFGGGQSTQSLVPNLLQNNDDENLSNEVSVSNLSDLELQVPSTSQSPQVEVIDSFKKPSSIFGAMNEGLEAIRLNTSDLKDTFSEMLRRQIESGRVVGSAGDLAGADDVSSDSGSGVSVLGGGGFLGKLGSAVKTGGAIFGTGLLLKDLYEGFTDEERISEITGKLPKDLNNAEQSAASLANAVESFSFGLIDASTAFELGVPAVETMQKGVDQLFDPEIGMFGTVTQGLIDAIDEFSAGNVIDGTMDLLSGFGPKLGARVFTVLGRWGQNLLDTLPSSVSSLITETVSDGLDQIFDPEIGLLGNITSSVFNAVDDFSSGNYLEGAKSLLKGIIVDAPKRVFEVVQRWVVGLIDFLPESISNSINNKIDDAKDLFSSAVSFGSGFLDSVNPFSDDSGVDGQASNSMSSGLLPDNNAAQNNQGKGLLQAVMGTRSQTTSKASLNGLPQQTVQASRDRERSLLEQRQAPQGQNQTVVVQQPAEQKRSMVRETVNPDLRLAFMNNGTMDN